MKNSLGMLLVPPQPFLKLTALSLLAAGVLSACQTPAPVKPTEAAEPAPALDARIKAEPPAMSPDAIAERGAQTFINAPGLTEDQKRKIMAIYVKTFNDAISIRNEIGQAKSLLFKLVATASFKSKEVEALKSRIVNLDQKRLRVMFKALEDIQGIVGTGKDKEELWKHFYDFETPRGDHVASHP